jgi:hypothetical protein
LSAFFTVAFEAFSAAVLITADAGRLSRIPADCWLAVAPQSYPAARQSNLTAIVVHGRRAGHNA